MQFSQVLKIAGFAVPVAGIAWKWLRTHNDRTIDMRGLSPSGMPDDRAIEQLIRDGKKIEALKAIRQKHRCSLTQARERMRQISRQIGPMGPG